MTSKKISGGKDNSIDMECGTLSPLVFHLVVVHKPSSPPTSSEEEVDEDDDPSEDEADSNCGHSGGDRDNDDDSDGDSDDAPLASPTFAITFPQLTVGPSQQGPRGGLGVFVRAGCSLRPGDALPIFGNYVTTAQVEKMKQRGQARYLSQVPGGVVNGDPALLPYRQVGQRGAAISSLINEPSRGSVNCLMVGAFIVVAEPLQGGDELLVSYGDDEYVRDYDVSRYATTNDVAFPHLEALGWTFCD